MKPSSLDESFHGSDPETDVLVGILHTAENEYERSIVALQRQTYRQWSAFVIRGLPNHEAHRALYDEFDRQRERVRYFVKLDADMVFVDDGALERAVAFMRERPDADHAEFAVHDWFTDGPMMGFHVYTRRARWPEVLEAIFVDRPPSVPGARLVVWSAPAPLVHHAPDPTPAQAAAFGVHRAIKVVQLGQPAWLAGDGLAQWRVLERVAVHYRSSQDERLAMALAGAARVLKGGLGADVDAYKRVAEGVMSASGAALAAEAEAFWRRPAVARVHALKAVGLRRAAWGVIRAVRRRLR